VILPNRGPNTRKWLRSDELPKEDGGLVDVLHEMQRWRRSGVTRKILAETIPNCLRIALALSAVGHDKHS
jgi:hypothetical protein